VVTSSVSVAGVLLVFSLLIMPAVATMLFTDDCRKRLFWGWGLGALMSLVGIYASARFDLPTGAAIVCAFGALVAGAYALRSFFPAPARR
jgi:zinc/manganese transport system permease protein